MNIADLSRNDKHFASVPLCFSRVLTALDLVGMHALIVVCMVVNSGLLIVP